MASKLQVQEVMDKTLHYWNSLPQAGQWALAGLGAFCLAKKALSFLQLFLNCFILSGTNVRLSMIEPAAAKC